MNLFKQGLNQFWVGAVFGLCFAISLILIPTAIIMSNINDVLKIHEVRVVIDKASLLLDNTQQVMQNTKQKLSLLEEQGFTLVLNAVKQYQENHATLDDEEKAALKTKLKQQLKAQLADNLSEQQLSLLIAVFDNLIKQEVVVKQKVAIE